MRLKNLSVETEIEACNAIYPDSVLYINRYFKSPKTAIEKYLSSDLIKNLRTSQKIVLLLCHENSEKFLILEIPETYPSVPPIYNCSNTISSDKYSVILSRVYFQQECIFAFLDELLKKEDSTTDLVKSEHVAPVKKASSPAAKVTPSESSLWSISDTIVDRKSVFTAQATLVHSHDQALRAHSLALQNKKVKKATHNIWAYRIKSENDVTEHFEDDGETAAGSRLLTLLQKMNTLNVFVIVSRWYGGTPLGSIRFKHINEVAEQALRSLRA